MRPAGAPPRAPEAETLDRAWGVVLGAFLLTMVGYGAIYSYAAFAGEIAASFGASQAALSLVHALSGSACLLVGALTGALADRLGARLLAAARMLLVALAFLVAAAAETLIEVHLGYGLLVGLGAGCAYVLAVALVQARFRAHRGLASGLAVSGIGVGTALVPPGSAALAALGDWRAGFLACAALAAVIGLAGAALLRPPPGESARVALAGTPCSPLRAPGFGRAYLGLFLVSLPAVLPHPLLVASAEQMGLPRGQALGLLGLIGIGTIAGRFLLAALADPIGRGRVFLLCAAGLAASLLAWAMGRDHAVLAGFALCFGALQGGFVALLPAHLADRFGPQALGTVIGALYTGRGLALLLGPPLAAFAMAEAGAAGPPLLLAAGLGLAGAWLLARPEGPVRAPGRFDGSPGRPRAG